MWNIYKKLIDGIPLSFEVEDFIVGVEFTMVKTKSSIGIARTINDRRFPMTQEPIIGMKLKKLAESAMSWNMIESSLGVAAMSAYYHSEEYLAGIKVERADVEETFNTYIELIEDKKTALVGHYKDFEDILPVSNDVLVLSSTPIHEEYPITAADFILPQQEAVILRGSTLTDKTLERYLEICKDTTVIMADYDVLPVPFLVEKQNAYIASFHINDVEKSIYLIKSGQAADKMWETGEMICIKNFI